MSFPELETAILGQERTDPPFGVNIRSDGGDVGERVDLMIRLGVKVASFALAPKKELLQKLKDAGSSRCRRSAPKRHAEKVAAWGADAVLIQGGEGGGHTGSVPTTLLLPQVVDAVDIPVVAAGGFFDGRGLVAALAYGAAGVGMGTRFLLTSDSNVSEQVKAIYLDTTQRHRRHRPRSTGCRTGCCAPNSSTSSRAPAPSSGSVRHAPHAGVQEGAAA